MRKKRKNYKRKVKSDFPADDNDYLSIEKNITTFSSHNLKHLKFSLSEKKQFRTTTILQQQKWKILVIQTISLHLRKAFTY